MGFYIQRIKWELPDGNWTYKAVETTSNRPVGNGESKPDGYYLTAHRLGKEIATQYPTLNHEDLQLVPAPKDRAVIGKIQVGTVTDDELTDVVRGFLDKRKYDSS